MCRQRGRGKHQHGQALAAVLVIMAVLFLLAGGVTMALSALVRQQGPNRTQTANDLAAQNAVAAAVVDISSGQTACGQPAGGSPLLAAPQFSANDWDLVGPWTGSTGTMLDFNPEGADLTGSATERNGTSWSDYTVIVNFTFPGGMALGTRIELDAGAQGPGTGYLVALQEPFSPSGKQPLWQVGLSGNPRTLPALPKGQPPSVTLELDVIGGVITARVISQPWNPPPVSFTSPTPAGTVALTVTSAAEVEVTSVQVDSGVPASEALSLAPPPGTGSFQCQRLDQVGPATSVAQQRVGLSSPQRSCDSGVSSAPVVALAPNQVANLWFTVALPQGTQPQALRLDLAPTNTQCPYSDGVSDLADCGNQRSTNWDPTLIAVAASCRTLPGGSQGPYYVYLTALSGTQTISLPFPLVDLHWAPSGNDSVYMTEASIPGQRYEEADLVLGQGSLALTYEGVLG